MGGGGVDTFQVPYSALRREHEEWLGRLGDAGAGIIVRGGAAQGEPVAGVARDNRASRWQKFDDDGLDELRDQGDSRTTFILRFTLSHPHSHTSIVGTRRIDHLKANLEGIAKGPISDDVYAEAKRRLDAIGESPEPAS